MYLGRLLKIWSLLYNSVTERERERNSNEAINEEWASHRK